MKFFEIPLRGSGVQLIVQMVVADDKEADYVKNWLTILIHEEIWR